LTVEATYQEQGLQHSFTSYSSRVSCNPAFFLLSCDYRDSQKSSRNEITLPGKAAEPPKADEYLKMLSGMARPTSPSPHQAG
jgi:hypothetical protein